MIGIEMQLNRVYTPKSLDDIQRCAYQIIFEVQRSTRNFSDPRAHLPYFDSAVPDPPDMAHVLIEATRDAMSDQIPLSLVRSTVDIILIQKRCSASQLPSLSDADVTVMRIVSGVNSFVTCPCELLTPESDTEKITLAIPDHYQSAIEQSSGIWLPQISPGSMRKFGTRQVFVTVADSANNYNITYKSYLQVGSVATTYTGGTVDLQDLLRQQMAERQPDVPFQQQQDAHK